MKSLLILFVFFISLKSQAFLNIEGLRQHDKEGFFGATSFVVSGAKGNTEKLETKFSTQNMYNYEQNEILSILDYAYGEVSEVKNTDKGSLHLRYTRKLSDFWRAETFYQIQYNDFQRLNQRSLYGLGLREEIFKSKAQSLYAGQGLFYETESFDESSARIRNNLYRFNFYLSYNREWASKGAFVFIVYYQPSLEKLMDHRIRANTGFSFNVWSNINVDILLSYSYDRSLPSDVKKTDLTHYTGFKIKY